MLIPTDTYHLLAKMRGVAAEEAMLAVVREHGDGMIEVDTLHPAFPKPPPVIDYGPGAELKRLLERIGIKPSSTCSCNARAQSMNDNEAREPGWCEAHMDEIVGWLREEAKSRKLPFIDAAGRLLVRMAIKRSRRNSDASV